MRKRALALTLGILFAAAPAALANGTGVSNSQGASSGGNATSSGATPQPH